MQLPEDVLEQDLYFYKGDEVERSFVFKDGDGNPENFTGSTFVASFRKSRTAVDSVPFEVSVNNETGTVTISLTSEKASLLSPECEYDVRMITIVDDVVIKRKTRITGTIFSTWDVTR